MKKKKQITVISNKSYNVTKGKNYAPIKQKMETQLTADMLRTGSYKDAKFKPKNLEAKG